MPRPFAGSLSDEDRGLGAFMTLARSSYAVSRRSVKAGTDAEVGVASEEGAAPAYPMMDALLGVD